MDIEHSRLLKFIVESKPKMEKHNLQIEDPSPSLIECEVPGQQKLREEKEKPSAQPVTNNTIEWVDLRDMITKPVYMGLQEEVIRTPHRIRPPRTRDESTANDKADKTTPEDHKPQTKIPVSKFKPVAERVLKQTRNAQESKREPPEKPRRSSIPKPKDKAPVMKKDPSPGDGPPVKIENGPVKEISGESPVKKIERKALKRDKIPILRKDQYKVTKKDAHAKKLEDKYEGRDENYEVPSNNNNDFINTDNKLDDEFDKLYDEIIDVEEASLSDEILDTKVKDPEKLESKFEEIVHQYDDRSVEQVKIEPVDKARYSRIPLLRRRSSHDVKVPRQFERRLSLKTGITNKPLEVKSDKVNDSTINDKVENEQNTLKENDPVQAIADTENENGNNGSNIEINNNDEVNRYNTVESPHPIPDYNSMPTPDAELVKLGIFGISPRDIPLDENNGNNSAATPEIETVKVAVIDIPTVELTENIKQDLETGEIKPEAVMQNNFKNKNGSDIIETNINVSENNVPEIQNIVEKQINNEVNHPAESLSYKPVTNDDIKPLQSPQPNILIRDPDNDLKSFELLKKANRIEERTKSRYINKPPLNENNKNKDVKPLEEDAPIFKGKVSSILKRLTSREDTKDVNKNGADKEAINVKEIANEIPKKKSVLSKIAMFEQADPEPPLPKKIVHHYSKPKRTISEEIKHTPKIVEEVLKPRGAKEEHENKIILVDIMKPIEIVTNNEEQITVVEDLKEELVTYDNLDDGKLSEIDNAPNVIEHSYTELTNNGTLNNKDGHREHKTNHIEPESSIQIVTTEENRIVNKTTTDDARLSEPRLPSTLESKNRTGHHNKKEKWKSTEALADYTPVKEKINRLKSHDGTNMKKAKSTAELDLGDAVKGKVKKMIVRMNSSEMLEFKKRETVEVINEKERPRKRSVSEKIALFERKLTPVSMETVQLDTARAFNIDSKPVKDSVNSVQLSEEYAAKIKQLGTAKLTYGGRRNMSYVELRDGRTMPALAMGTALLDPRLAKHIVATAIDLGYRAVDTAFIYGNEREVGEGIRAKIQDGTVRREELFIMSKLWSTFHRPDLVEAACRASLAATGLDYFDLYMIHNPMSLKEGGDPLPKIANVLQFSEYDYLDAWFAMEELVAKGLVRSIGVSNFNSVQLARVVEKGRIKPVVNQVECHPYLSQQRLSDFCSERGVRLSCFGVLGSKGTPAELKGAQDAAIDDPLVQVMAAGLGISPAQLLIKYQLDSGHAAVVKASTAAHLWNNLEALDVTLQPAQVTALTALNKNKRTFTFKGMGDTHRNYPFKIPF